MAAMSSSVAEGTTLRKKDRDEKKAEPLMAIIYTFLVQMNLAVAHRVHVAERSRGPFAFAPDSA